MREIKFRAWNGEYMVSPEYIDRKGVAHWRENSIPESFTELMQYTGLKDKNGKEIYEGDVITCVYSNTGDDIRHKAIVEWVEDFCGFEPWVRYDSDCQWYDGGDPEIIGNIYENPELLHV